MEFIKKYGSSQKNRIYIDNSKLENEIVDVKEFRRLKGRFYKKSNQWIFPLDLNTKTESEIIVKEKISTESQSIEENEEVSEEEEVESIEREVESIHKEEIESVEEISIKEEEEIESVEEISIKEEEVESIEREVESIHKEEIESVEEISVKEEEEIESVEEISIKEEEIEDVRENKYLCVDEPEYTESESDVCSSICVDEVQKFTYIMKPPQELYDALDDYLKLIY